MVVTLDIEGMHSASCADNIESVLKKLNGVQDVRVSLMSKKAKIRMDYDASLDMIIQTIVKAGYYAYFEIKK